MGSNIDERLKTLIGTHKAVQEEEERDAQRVKETAAKEREEFVRLFEEVYRPVLDEVAASLSEYEAIVIPHDIHNPPTDPKNKQVIALTLQIGNRTNDISKMTRYDGSITYRYQSPNKIIAGVGGFSEEGTHLPRNRESFETMVVKDLVHFFPVKKY